MSTHDPNPADSLPAVDHGLAALDPEQAVHWLAAMVEASEDAIVFVDHQWRILFWSRRAEHLLGWSAATVLGKGLGSVIGLTPEGGRTLRRAFSGRSGLARERVSLRRAGGTAVEVSISVRVLAETADGSEAGCLVSLRDDVASSVANEFQKFFFAVDQSMVAVVIADPAGVVEYVNHRAVEMLGRSPLQLVGVPLPVPLWAPAGPEPTTAAGSRDPLAQRRDPVTDWRGDSRLRRDDGSMRDLYVVASGIRDAAGRLANRVVLFEDISERRELEEAERELREGLAHSGRLAALGEMATTIAHELNQPLSSIANFNQGTLRRLEAGKWEVEPIIHALQEVSREVARARDIMQNVRRFARHQRSAPVAVDLRQLVQQLLPMLHMAVRAATAHIELECSAPRPVVLADETQMAQVVLNLARNGLDAMAGQPGEPRPLQIVIDEEAGECSGRWLRCSVIDRGCGVSDEQLGDLGKPFVTTKPGGLGLGLSITRTLLEAHGSHLDVRRNPPDLGGMNFSFALPVYDGDQEVRR